MKKIIAIDLDGTLLNHQSKLSQTTIDYIKEIKKDHLVLLSTGRPFYTSFQFYKQLELGSPLITDNGGSIWFLNNQELTTFGVNPQIVNKLFQQTKPYIKSAFFINGKDIYTYNHNPLLLKIFYIYINDDELIHTDLENLDVHPTGFVVLVDGLNKLAFEHFVLNELSDEVGLRNWGSDAKHGVYEIYLKDTSKLSAIHHVVDAYGLNRDDVIAFGDGINDIEMIEGVAHGVAMHNAVKQIKEVAKDITELPHDQDGVVKHLDKLLNAK